jgi:hypothetical protein
MKTITTTNDDDDDGKRKKIVKKLFFASTSLTPTAIPNGDRKTARSMWRSGGIPSDQFPVGAGFRMRKHIRFRFHTFRQYGVAVNKKQARE